MNFPKVSKTSEELDYLQLLTASLLHSPLNLALHGQRESSSTSMTFLKT
jgi:hypothetical protein